MLLLGLSSVDFAGVSVGSDLCVFCEGQCWVCPMCILRGPVLGLSYVDSVNVSVGSVLCGFFEGQCWVCPLWIL